MNGRSWACGLLVLASAVGGAGAKEPRYSPISAGEIADKCRAAIRPDDIAAPLESRLSAATDVGYCYAYLQAVQDERLDLGNPVHCIPKGTTPREVVQAFVAQFDRISYLSSDERGVGVNAALQTAFPCSSTASTRRGL